MDSKIRKYNLLFNMDVGKKLGNITKALDGIIGYLKKLKEGSYTIEERDGVIESYEGDEVHEDRSAHEVTASLEHAIFQTLGELLDMPKLSEKSKGLIITVINEMNRYKDVEHVYGDSAKLAEVQLKILNAVKLGISELNRYMSKSSLFD